VEPTDETLKVTFRDLILDEDTAMTDVDIVVLATGQVPNSGVNIDLPAEEQEKAEIKPISILNLNYRQGKDLPHLKNGFADSHFICFPYETRRTGIYTAGPCAGPWTSRRRWRTRPEPRSRRSRLPRTQNWDVPRIRARRSVISHSPARRLHAVQALHRGMPFGAIDEDEKRYPVFNESRCRRCGTCMAPARCA